MAIHYTDGGVIYTGTQSPAQTAGSGAAYTLDTYEEGTWTPAITSNTNVIGISGGTTRAFYCRIGEVTQISMELNGVTLSGTVQTTDNFIGGLPFLCNARTAISILNQWASLFTTNVTGMVGLNQTRIELVTVAYPYAGGNLNNVTSATYWMIAGSYITT